MLACQRGGWEDSDQEEKEPQEDAGGLTGRIIDFLEWLRILMSIKHRIL